MPLAAMLSKLSSTSVISPAVQSVEPRAPAFGVKETDSRDAGIHSGRQAARSRPRIIAGISGIYRACIVSFTVHGGPHGTSISSRYSKRRFDRFHASRLATMPPRPHEISRSWTPRCDIQMNPRHMGTPRKYRVARSAACTCPRYL